jgi:hypothetical protein
VQRLSEGGEREGHISNELNNTRWGGDTMGRDTMGRDTIGRGQDGVGMAERETDHGRGAILHPFRLRKDARIGAAS